MSFNLLSPRGYPVFADCPSVNEARPGQILHFRDEVDEPCCVCGRVDSIWTDREEWFDDSKRKCGPRAIAR